MAFLAVFFFYPLLTIFGVSLAPERRTRSVLLWAVFQRPLLPAHDLVHDLAGDLLDSADTGAGATGAYVFARYQFPGKNILRALTTIPFVLPTVVVAAAFGALLGPQGRVNLALMELFGLEQPHRLNLRHTLAIILLAHIFYNYAVVLRLVGGFWANLNPRLEEAAAVLGAGPLAPLSRDDLPLLMPAVGAAALLVLSFASPALAWCCSWAGRASPP